MTLRNNIPVTRSRFPALISGLIAAIALIPLFVAPPAVASTVSPVATRSVSTALVTDGFQAGNIISDANFFNTATMDASQIDTFLRSKVKTCQTGYTCLKDYRQNTPNRPADSYCKGYAGAASELSSTIIYKVAQSCGINPQVLLVMLQKEQSLVTYTYPDATRYSRAMGQGCPDTAGCDPQYAGFFYQVYYAARQMQLYVEGRYFTWYAPGKTWNILYHPTASRGCGSSPVFVQNAATSALYYYTPYQPNTAALLAGYGTGDSCSSYGNRNFYNYFKDWFGNPTGPYLVRSTSSDPLYLVAGDTKYHVQSPDDLNTFTARFGPFRLASQQVVDRLSTGGPATRAVRDPRTGVIALLEPDGTRHRFRSVDSMTTFGYPTAMATDMPPSVIDAFSPGPEVAQVFRQTGQPDVFLFAEGTRRHVYDATALTPLLTTQATYVATISSEALQRIAEKPTYFGANRLIRGTTRDAVYLTTATSMLIHVPSLSLAARFGGTSLTIAPDSAIAPTAVVRDMLLPAVQCGNELRIVDGGYFRVMSGSTTVRSTALTAADCAAFPRPTGQALAAPVFVSAPDSSDLFMIEKSALRHVWSYADVLTMAAGGPVTTISWPAETRNDYGVGEPLKALDGSFLQFSTRAEVYRADGAGVLHHVTTASTLRTLGGPSPRIDTRPIAQRALFTIGSPLLDEAAVVRFGNGADVYVMKAGVLRHVGSWNTLLALGAGTTPRIDSVTGSVLTDFKVGKSFLADGLFVKFSGSDAVYVVDSGLLRHIQSAATLTRLGGGKVPPIETLAQGSLANYDVGAPLP